MGSPGLRMAWAHVGLRRRASGHHGPAHVGVQPGRPQAQRSPWTQEGACAQANRWSLSQLSGVQSGGPQTFVELVHGGSRPLVPARVEMRSGCAPAQRGLHTQMGLVLEDHGP